MITGIGLAFGSKNALVDRYQPRPDQCDGVENGLWQRRPGWHDAAIRGYIRVTSKGHISDRRSPDPGSGIHDLAMPASDRLSTAPHNLVTMLVVAVVAAPAVPPL